ncbi:MAG: TetR/AcrR family transcriptional regulator [Sedimentibacter sp.]
MSRNREFNYQEVINKALNLFWLKGYHNTSVQDLVDHLELGRGSLYNTFGNKHDLFLEVLDNYIANRDAELLRKLKVSPVRDAFKNYMYATINRIVSDENNQGCFIVNTMTELASTDNEVAIRLKKSEKQLVACYTEALCFGKENGELYLEKDPYQIALFLSNTMKGLRVISRVNNSKEELENIVRIALTILY